MAKSLLVVLVQLYPYPVASRIVGVEVPEVISASRDWLKPDSEEGDKLTGTLGLIGKTAG